VNASHDGFRDDSSYLARNTRVVVTVRV